MIGRRLMLALVLVSVLGTIQMQGVAGTEGGDPSVRWVEFNDERKWPGQTHIVKHGVTLHVVAALKEPHKQSMKADLIFIDENDDARIFRMTCFNTDGIYEWHEYYLDTATLNPGPYVVRIKVWNTKSEATEDYEGVSSEEIVWGDLYLSLQTQQQVAPEAPKIPGFPWEAVAAGILLAVAVIVGRRRQPLPAFH